MIDASVLITCYNKEKYLSDCIESVARQTREPKEIIVVHDGCDEPMSHVKAETIIKKENRGVAKARDDAFRFSSGKLILFVDGDDLLDPDYLEKMAWVIGKGADVAFPDLFLWGDIGSRLVIMPKQLTPAFIKEYNRVLIPVTCLMKRELYEQLGGFKELLILEDLDFWIRAMCLDKVFRKAETLLWYRKTQNNRNSSLSDLRRKEMFNSIMGQFVFSGGKMRLKKEV